MNSTTNTTEDYFSSRKFWGRMAFLLSFGINIGLALIKIVVGLAINSIAMIADAIDNFLDLITSILAFIGLFWSSKPADSDHQYGHEKGEVVSAFFIAILLVFSGIFIITESINRSLRQEFMIFSLIGILASSISMLGKFVLYHFLLRISERIDSQGIRADAYNYRMDIVTSFGVMVAIFFSYFKLYFFDPIIAFLIAFLIFKTAWGIIRHSAMVILDEAPPGMEQEVYDLVNPIPDVIDIHKLRIRHFGSNRGMLADCHIRVKSHISVDQAHTIMNQVEECVYKNTEITELLIHIEPEDQPC